MLYQEEKGSQRTTDIKPVIYQREGRKKWMSAILELHGKICSTDKDTSPVE
jgi:hypothetical protein